jgi:hypothetical protein
VYPDPSDAVAAAPANDRAPMTVSAAAVVVDEAPDVAAVLVATLVLVMSTVAFVSPLCSWAANAHRAAEPVLHATETVNPVPPVTTLAYHTDRVVTESSDRILV